MYVYLQQIYAYFLLSISQFVYVFLICVYTYISFNRNNYNSCTFSKKCTSDFLKINKVKFTYGKWRRNNYKFNLHTNYRNEKIHSVFNLIKSQVSCFSKYIKIILTFDQKQFWSYEWIYFYNTFENKFIYICKLKLFTKVIQVNLWG